MPVSKRIHTNSDEWFRKRHSRLQKDRDFVREQDSLIELKTSILPKEDFETLLSWYVCAAVSPHQNFHAVLDRVWASKAGMTWKSVRRFPERLRRLANEVERTNAGDPLFYARQRSNKTDRNENEFLQILCGQLPDNIRTYAKTLEERNITVELTTRRRSSPLFNLSDLVRFITGGYRDNQVASLLNTASFALDGEKRDKFDAQTIVQARYRHRRKATHHNDSKL